jgi:hypothetical protein
VVQTGTHVDFPDSDNIRHEVYLFWPAKVFTMKLYSGRQAAPVEFNKAGVVTLGCNIHDHMLAGVKVVETPYFNKSATDGTSTLAGLEPGDYRLSVWYPGSESEPQVQQIHGGVESATRVIVVLQPLSSRTLSWKALPRVPYLGGERQRLGFADCITLQEVDAHAPRRIDRGIILHLLGDDFEVQ